MTEDLLKSKIELLEAQIANLEQSGFFTEKEIDRLSGPLKLELETLRDSETRVLGWQADGKTGDLIDKSIDMSNLESKQI